MIENGRIKSHSGEGTFWGNLIATALCVVIFLGCLYAMSFWDFENVWIPGGLALALAVLAFIIPKNLLGRGDSVNEDVIYDDTHALTHRGH